MAPEAPAHLTIEVYTAPSRTFVSAIAPQGPGDEPTWSPSVSYTHLGPAAATLCLRQLTDPHRHGHRLREGDPDPPGELGTTRVLSLIHI